jgi:hypothetical protein
MAELIFNPNKDSVYIRFSNGKESIIYSSLSEVIPAIHDCYLKQKITKEEEALITNLDCKMRICPGQKYAHCLFFDVFA